MSNLCSGPFAYSVVCAMSSYQGIYEANLTRKRFIISLLGMTIKEKDGSVMILPVL